MVRADRLFAVVLGVGTVVSAPAGADAPLPVLVVTRSTGATDCPDAPALAAEVERMHGRPSLETAARSVSTTRLHVEISRGLEGYSAVIRALGARSGERRLSDTGASCQNLAEALALTLAIILDASQGSIVSNPPAERVTANTPGAFEPRLGAPAAGAQGKNSVDLGAGIGFHAGVLARAGPFFAALGRLGLGEWLMLEAGGFVTAEQSLTHEPPPLVARSGKLELQLAAGFVGICARLASERSPFRLVVCAEPYVGRLTGTGSGFERDYPTQAHLWLAGGLALDGDGTVTGPLRWYVRSAGLKAMSRSFVVRVDGEQDALFETPSAALLASTGLRFHFD